ncbi:protein DYAD-like [Juglans microcarpa x Juglans regia]|uniref:protein DYAD-like n=1 Tax=Juglans microcarpa x Juglans regia TaxID=2249226 RepID=UPI001B7E3824|nr:protein DYAD-like [Juglans microcarpa x Juglans regia]XP_040998927.1 protein DYAD-like [Juglans microcarpa x Juglans regia]
MAQWAGRKQVGCISEHGEIKPRCLLRIAEDVVLMDEVKAAGKDETLAISEIRKRKRLGRSQLREMKAAERMKERQSMSYISRQSKRDARNRKGVERWSAERYELAEQSMFEVLKAEGATFGNPISRLALRTAARKRIGDTGLLDHLLKHIDGKVIPGGTERFRRCFSPNGVMEYWLESADLANIRQEAGWQDPFWFPPNRWPGCAPSLDSVSSGELMLLKKEMVNLKRDMQEFISKNQEQDPAEVMHKDLVKYKTTVDEHLKEITSSLVGMKGMQDELIAWKVQVEQQLVEIKNSLSSIQASKQVTALSLLASERWEDWLESSNLDSIQGNELAPFYESADLVNVKQVQNPYSTLPPQMVSDPICARDLELFKEEMGKTKRDVPEMVPKKQEEDHANVTPDSSATTNSKSDRDNSLLPFQEMIMELFKWKDKMEQRLEQISNSVSCMQASNQIDFLQPFSC